MPTYYEIIKVDPRASLTEIETALDKNYNQWRQLVTHHDPQVVNQANQALQSLEQIRSTLTDLTRRSAYDAGIGLGGVVQGLADPDAVLRSAVPQVVLTPPAIAGTAGQRQDAWVCQKCGTTNPIGTAYCQQCGTLMGKDCPKCGHLASVRAVHCPNCGINMAEFQKEVEQEQKRKEDERKRRDDEEKQYQERTQHINEEIQVINQKISTLMNARPARFTPGNVIGRTILFSIFFSPLLAVIIFVPVLVVFENPNDMISAIAVGLFFGLWLISVAIYAVYTGQKLRRNDSLYYDITHQIRIQQEKSQKLMGEKAAIISERKL